jgi:hypothetical protein
MIFIHEQQNYQLQIIVLIKYIHLYFYHQIQLNQVLIILIFKQL